MNNQKIGKEFENEMVEILKNRGYWVHFIVPNAAGRQPFDIVAAKNDKPYAIDCKTCVKSYIELSRLEDDQIFAFELWKRRGNGDPIVAVKHKDRVHLVSYTELSVMKKIPLTDDNYFCDVEVCDG